MRALLQVLVGPTLERVDWVPVDFLTEVMVLCVGGVGLLLLFIY